MWVVDFAATTAFMIAAAGGVLSYGVRGRSSRMFGPSLWRGPRDRKCIALTFDDGPSEATPELLEVLDIHGVRATFFQCGMNARRLPGVSRDVASAGHELGNHTWSHPSLIGLTKARIRQEVGDTQRIIGEAAGVTPRFFRAPYGHRWFGLGTVLQEHRLTGVMWTVLGYDWEWRAEEIARHVAAHTSNGGILCLHDGDRVSARVDRANTLQAVRLLVPKLYDRGFAFLTVGELLQRPGVTGTAH